jgi:hypothetical protein
VFFTLLQAIFIRGEILVGTIDDGCLLYHHSCKDTLSGRINKVIIVGVGLDPGCNNSTAYDGQRLDP